MPKNNVRRSNLYDYAMDAGNLPDAIFRLDCLRINNTDKVSLDAITRVENFIIKQWEEYARITQNNNTQEV